jgi:hypothetical protein
VEGKGWIPDLLEWLSKITKEQAGSGDVPAKIRARYLQNTSQKYYH